LNGEGAGEEVEEEVEGKDGRRGLLEGEGVSDVTLKYTISKLPSREKEKE